MKRIILGAVLGVGVILGSACNSDATRPVEKEGDSQVKVMRPVAPPTGDRTMVKPTQQLPEVGRTVRELDLRAKPAEKGFVAVLRMRGENPQGVSGLFLGMKDVKVFAGGKELAVSAPRDAVMNLANATHAWELGRFTVPAGTTSVQVAMQIDDYGGFESAGRSGTVNARTAPITFEATAEQLAVHGHAVVHLNVDRSLFDVGNGERLLLPKVTVRH